MARVSTHHAPLLSPGPVEVIPIAHGELWWFPEWLSPPLADLYYQQLWRGTAWRQSEIRMAGRRVPIPRLNAWYGEAAYRYSGVRFEPLPMIRPLAALRDRLERTLAEHFSQGQEPLRPNSALVNCYRHGQDSVAWHADDEPELGPRPQIASVSLGGSRRFVLKPKEGGRSGKRELWLSHGSLLLMLGDIQRHWLHALPKTTQSVGPRINVTFREIGAP